MYGEGESSAPLDRRPARRTNPATVNRAPAAGGGNDSDSASGARPASYQGDYRVTSHSHARPRILLIRSNTDRNSEQVYSALGVIFYNEMR